MPAEARDGAMLCSRCYFRLQRLLSDAPDIVGLLRSKADPTKAQVYDRVLVSSSKPIAPAPVEAMLIDASADVIRVLRDWADLIDGTTSGYRLAPGAGADTAHDVARGFVAVIMSGFDELANGEDVQAFADAFLSRHPGDPADWDTDGYWSLADVAARWPFDDQPRWATVPCPECDTKSIRVHPPRRRGGPFHYECVEEECGWEADSQADDGLWGDVYAITPAEDWPVTVRALCSPCVAGRHDECTGCECREHAPDAGGTSAVVSTPIPEMTPALGSPIAGGSDEH
ncbi:MAG: hypothetical protein LBE05_05825 [Microbacterium sp.]|nr:hypothetical protein [Microbacterium sp.]